MGRFIHSSNHTGRGPLRYSRRFGRSMISDVDGPGSGILCFGLLFAFRITFDDADKVVNEVVPKTGLGFMFAHETNNGSNAHLLNMTTTQDTITGDPIICTITRIPCCQAVRELRSMVPKPVPVAALTQMKRESMYLMWNSPLDAQKITDQKSGIRRLNHG